MIYPHYRKARQPGGWRFDIFQKIGSAVFILDAHSGVVLLANQKAGDFYGLPAQRMAGMSMFDFDLRPREVVWGQVRQALGVGPAHFLAAHRLADGSTRQVRVELGRETYHKRAVLIATIIDMSEQKGIEASLRESEQKNRQLTMRLNNIIEGGRFGTWEWNVQTGEAIYNQRWAEILGYSLDELMPADIHVWEKFMHPDDLRESYAYMNDVLAGRALHYDMECRLRHKNGSWVWVQDQGSVAEWDAEGNPLWMVGTHADISARKQTEAALRASEERLQQLIAHIEEVFWLFDIRENRMVYISPAYETIWGRTCDSLYQNPHDYIDCILPEDRHVMLEGLQMQAKGERTGMEYRVLRPDGSMRWILDRSFPIFDADGALVRVAGIALDVTELKNARLALQEMNADLERRVIARTAELDEAIAGLKVALGARDEFVAAISHELRTPLTGILGLSQVLQMPSYGPLNEKQALAVGHIQQNGQRLLDMVNDVIEYTMLQSGRVFLRTGPCLLNATCQVAVRKIGPLAEKKKQRVHLDVPAGPVTLLVDEIRLNQVLQHLLVNASKFTPEGGEFGLQMQAHAAENTICLVVWDKGIGMEPGSLQDIFLPFVQLDASLARKYEGTGLGLALVRKLVELLGGEIAVQSAPNQGSRFSISLPWKPG